MNYIGYFISLKGVHYNVKIITDASSSTFKEIALAGEEPFVAKYNTSDSPFAPVRTSTATIRVVSDEYLADVLSPYAQGTQVILNRVDGGYESIEWCGYLTPKIYDQGYSDCYEEIELEAADCISSLQYFDYKTEDGVDEFEKPIKKIVTFKSIINRLCDKCGLLDGYLWCRGQEVYGRPLLPDYLSISEYNFFSTDTDEAWKMDEVLEELCRYLGLTCLQWHNRMYFINYQNFHDTNRLDGYQMLKAYDYRTGSVVPLPEPISLSAGSYRGSDNSISFEPIYNLARVTDNFNTCEDFIPGPMDDNFLINRIDEDDFYANYEVLPESPNAAKFPKTLRTDNSKYSDEESDKNYRYFHRPYNHRYWESVYHDADGQTIEQPSAEIQATSAITRDYMGGTIIDLGSVHKEYSNEYQQWIVPNKLDYDRYLCLCCKYSSKNSSYYGTQPVPQYTGPFEMFRLKPGFKAPVMLSDNSYLVIHYSTIWERYKNRAYINPDWLTDECNVGGLQGGGQMHGIGNLMFYLQIGDKYWAKNQWKAAPTAHTATHNFQVSVEKTSDQHDIWNTELTVLNNVSWDLFVNAEGYKIPLAGVDTTQEITFIIYRPTPQFMWNSGSNKFHTEFEYNAYCWVKDFTIKCVQEGEDTEQEENDVVYENEIDVDSVREFSDITVKFTTYTDLTKPAYSNVIYNGTTGSALLTELRDTHLTTTAQVPEQNIVQRYVDQYSTQTRKLTLQLDMTATPFTKVFYADVENPSAGYCQLGTDINYKDDKQSITLIEKK